MGWDHQSVSWRLRKEDAWRLSHTTSKHEEEELFLNMGLCRESSSTANLPSPSESIISLFLVQVHLTIHYKYLSILLPLKTSLCWKKSLINESWADISVPHSCWSPVETSILQPLTKLTKWISFVSRRYTWTSFDL